MHDFLTSCRLHASDRGTVVRVSGTHKVAEWPVGPLQVDGQELSRSCGHLNRPSLASCEGDGRLPLRAWTGDESVVQWRERGASLHTVPAFRSVELVTVVPEDCCAPSITVTI